MVMVILEWALGEVRRALGYYSSIHILSMTMSVSDLV